MSASTTDRPYYPALDGLRAVSAVLVFLFHYGPLPMGWIGVDIFFVLSGFLITGLLFDASDQPDRYRTFYISRSLRIFPLYYGILIALLVSSRALHARWSWPMLLWPLYLGNWLAPLFRGGRAFDFIGLAAIGHFWSLCVEEQFYLLWPLVVFRMRSRGAIERACLAIWVVVFMVRALLAWTVPQASVNAEFLHRSTFLRLDALALGGFLAMRMRGPAAAGALRAGPRLVLTAVAALIGYTIGVGLLVGAPALAPFSRWMATAGYSLIDVMAAGLILVSLEVRSPWVRMLTLKPLRTFGRMTYGFYVLHQLPIQLFVRLDGAMTAAAVPAPAARILVILLAFSVSYAGAHLSYRFFETPFLKMRPRANGSSAQRHSLPLLRSQT